MVRQRRGSNISHTSSVPDHDQELGSMYDYLAKIILLGPSGTGKSCLLHRFVKNEFRTLTSQTIGVEFSSKIIKIGPPPRRKRIKLQLWDTAGTERFRSVSRSYYRGAAGAILVYDVASHGSFSALPTFLNDARALASPDLTVLLAGNKVDVATGGGDEAGEGGGGGSHLLDRDVEDDQPDFSLSATPSSTSASISTSAPRRRPSTNWGLGSQQTATQAPYGREVTSDESARWASKVAVPVSVEVSAYTGDGVDELFARLARMILTKIELGEIDPDDPQSGIQYGDSGAWGGGGGADAVDGGSMKSGMETLGGRGGRRRGTGAWGSGMREWEAVFGVGGRRRKAGCC